MANAILTNQTAIVKPATVAPVIDGVAAVGVSSKYAREDHVHPTDTSRASQSDLNQISSIIEGFTEDIVETNVLFSNRISRTEVATILRIDKVRGFSFLFSQLVNNGAVTDPLTANHKYAVKNSDTWSIKTGTECGSITWASGDQCIDMTQIFGSGNEPTDIGDFREMFAGSSYSYTVNKVKSGQTEVLGSGASSYTESFPGTESGPIELRRVGNTYDELTKSKITRRIGTRDYESGDESDPSVLTDGTTTLYVLSEPVETLYTGYTLQIPVKPGYHEYLDQYITAYPLDCDLTYLGIDDSAVETYTASRLIKNRMNNSSGIIVYTYTSTTDNQASTEVQLDMSMVYLATHVEIIYTDYLNGNDFHSTGILPFKLISGQYSAPNFTTTLRYNSLDTYRDRSVGIGSSYKLTIGSCKEYISSSVETTNQYLIVRQVKLYRIDDSATKFYNI